MGGLRSRPVWLEASRGPVCGAWAQGRGGEGRGQRPATPLPPGPPRLAETLVTEPVTPTPGPNPGWDRHWQLTQPLMTPHPLTSSLWLSNYTL